MFVKVYRPCHERTQLLADQIVFSSLKVDLKRDTRVGCEISKGDWWQRSKKNWPLVYSSKSFGCSKQLCSLVVWNTKLRLRR